MSTIFDTSFTNGDQIEAGDPLQFAEPIANLEKGSALYREDTGSPNAYKVDFSSGNVISSLEPGQVIRFRAKNTNTSGTCTLTVTGPSGDLASQPIRKKGNATLDNGDIKGGEVIAVVFTENAGGLSPRFEIIGASRKPPKGILADEVYKINSSAAQTVSPSSWTTISGYLGYFSVSANQSSVLLKANFTIEAYPGQSTRTGNWRLLVTGPGTYYVPDFNGHSLVSPYNLSEQSSFGGSWVLTGLSSGTYTVTLQMKANSGSFYGRTANTNSACTALVLE